MLKFKDSERYWALKKKVTARERISEQDYAWFVMMQRVVNSATRRKCGVSYRSMANIVGGYNSTKG